MKITMTHWMGQNTSCSKSGRGTNPVTLQGFLLLLRQCSLRWNLICSPPKPSPMAQGPRTLMIWPACWIASTHALRPRIGLTDTKSQLSKKAASSTASTAVSFSFGNAKLLTTIFRLDSLCIMWFRNRRTAKICGIWQKKCGHSKFLCGIVW